MAPGRFRRRLSEDHTDLLDLDGRRGEGAPGTPAQVRVPWLGGRDAGTGSTRGKLPWLSPSERRHPLRDLRLSCFRSYITPASSSNSPAGSGANTREAASSPHLGLKNKSRSPTASPRSARQSKSPARSPGRSRACKSNENVYSVSPPAALPTPTSAPAPAPAQVPEAKQCLGARLRALSARCLALVHADRHLTRKAHISGGKASEPCKQRSFSSGALPGLHDFQRRQLQRDEPPLSTTPSNGGSEEDGDSGILVSEAATNSTPLSSLPGNASTGRTSLPWSSARDVWGTSTAASRALRSASLDRELFGGSTLLHQDDVDDACNDNENGLIDNERGQAHQSRSSTKSSSSSSEISEIFSRFQRRRVAGGGGAGLGFGGGGGSRPSSPPLLPAPPQRPAPGVATRRRAFHLVRLARATPAEELGIFIAKSEAPDRGAQGYIVAHVVPGGLAHRDGQLRLGDELVVVNGRQLRGLSMAAARQRLRAGPTQVDIVIARPLRCRCRCLGGADAPEGRDSGLDSELDTSGDSMPEPGPGCLACRSQQDFTPTRTLQESSVDYENVVLCPREPPQPGPGLEPPADQSSSSPSPGLLRRQQLFQKHSASAKAAARRSLALVSRPSSPPLGAPPPLGLSVPVETQHHSLKRRGKRSGAGGGGAARRDAVGGAEFRVELRKGPGCGALGFTVVGGADSPRGSLPIFVRSVLEGGQAAQDGRLQPGDELLALNGQPLRGATHSEAVAMFRAVRAGPVQLTVCRRTSKKAQSCSDLVVDSRTSPEERHDQS